MKTCLYQLLLVLSLFVVAQTTEVTTINEDAVTSTTRKPYLRSLWNAWTANSSTSSNVQTTNTNSAPEQQQQQSVARCSLCHDGSFPKNPSHGVVVSFVKYSFTGTCSNLYYDLQSKVYQTDQICNPLQDRFDWSCGCNANYKIPGTPAGSVNMGNGFGTWNIP